MEQQQTLPMDIPESNKSLSEMFGPLRGSPRPSRYDKEVREAAVDAIMPSILEWMGDDDPDADGCRSDLLDVLRYGDSTEEMICTLHDRHDWEVSGLYDVLDGIHSEVESAFSARLASWLRANDIKPRLVEGSDVTVRAYNHQAHRDQQASGRIVGIDHKRGTYTVCCPDLGHGARDEHGGMTIGVNLLWEDVEAMNPETRVAVSTPSPVEA